MSHWLFVYGTLKQGCCNHAQLAGQKLIGDAQTPPGFQLYDLGGYPGIGPDPLHLDGVHGEVWEVSTEALARLDAFEGVTEGLYERRPIRLLAPFHQTTVEAYFPVVSLAGRRALGTEWKE